MSFIFLLIFDIVMRKKTVRSSLFVYKCPTNQKNINKQSYTKKHLRYDDNETYAHYRVILFPIFFFEYFHMIRLCKKTPRKIGVSCFHPENPKRIRICGRQTKTWETAWASQILAALIELKLFKALMLKMMLTNPPFPYWLFY